MYNVYISTFKASLYFETHNMSHGLSSFCRTSSFPSMWILEYNISLMIELCFWECIIWWLPVCDGPLFLNFRPVLMLLPSADIVRRKEIITSCPLVCWVLWSQCSPVQGIEWVTWTPGPCWWMIWGTKNQWLPKRKEIVTLCINYVYVL